MKHINSPHCQKFPFKLPVKLYTPVWLCPQLCERKEEKRRKLIFIGKLIYARHHITFLVYVSSFNYSRTKEKGKIDRDNKIWIGKIFTLH